MNGLFPECLISWSFSWLGYTNTFPHVLHVTSCMFLWTVWKENVYSNWGFLNVVFGYVHHLNREPKILIKWYGFHLFVLLKLLRRLKPFTTDFTGAIFGFVVFLLVRFQLTGVSKSPITDITRVRPPLHVYRHVSLRMTCLTDKINPHHTWYWGLCVGDGGGGWIYNDESFYLLEWKPCYI